MPLFDVIYQTDELVAINKAADTSFHDETGSLGVANQLSKFLDTQLWPVHRLDKMTSGVLLFAKSKDTAIKINQLFAQQQVHKVYWALSEKKPKKKQGKVIGDMSKSRGGNWKLLQTKDNPAETQFHSCALIPGIRFFWVQPRTGKTHQIRVALKALGAPILGDSRYQGSSSDRGYLHAYRLSFEWQGQTVSIKSMPKTGEYFLIPEIKNCMDRFK